jgi:hypothetical protein
MAKSYQSMNLRNSKNLAAIGWDMAKKGKDRSVHSVQFRPFPLIAQPLPKF